ncbi:hypothetical protein AGRHK599_LOCUS1531 [Rhizobium rhizogenes]|uniref:DUF192 domain-containing protein n=1 Tax=Rhizobium rhizogenes TaxID=359 RepID=A0AAN2A238_RHIRH|nr:MULTISPECIES: DUF192 domain-containing protein [Rhizobium/Agrobacterium group]MCZ7443297.1 DUF192 domain-containing protein [Rhizobium rhizogenes]NSZ79283.1 DUF192 domain-containing protein [Agrobacterium tumefaciens]OAM66041.1 hypothetical protein A8L48_24075 [Rhizobium rhizogenes]CAD0211731.1 hypothetical protein AGRHK599_LOCUS1531 [Rhizobium rhizogenes]
MAALRAMVKSAVMALLFFTLAGTAQSQERQIFSSEPLTVETASGKAHDFVAELALDNAQREQGLMFRKSMPPENGMLFDFGEARDVAMWMRNTLIPLDMLFIARDGRITHIHENAVPHSEAIISSRGPVKFVLELNGGTAKRYGIKPGDMVRSAQIGNRK